MKIVCFADTHRCFDGLQISDAVIVICAGDFCNTGSFEDVIVFNKWFSKLSAKYKIVVAGNHDVCFEKNLQVAKSLFDKDIIYLQDDLIEIGGVKLYGSPWQVPFMNWAFNLPEDNLAETFAHIPDDVDILITHSPPYGILDSIPEKKGLGSKALLEKVLQIKPKYHIFGHIHHGYGEYLDKENGIAFLNVSLLDEGYNSVNEPKIIEI